ncbi:MAG: VanZ family protein [Bacilli bacterium]|nr:VanZ family protein [Bacilli bacterium]
MEIYKLPIQVAIIVFPVIAFILTLPFLVYEYRKFGSIHIIKSVVFFSFILYIITAYFMVILPLPKIEDVLKYKGNIAQLHPFRFINDITVTTNFKINDLNSLLRFLNKSTVYTVILNFFLLLPFGVYLRYLFDRKWYQSIILSFLLSLFFELTQLTGLYGIYPRPYRLFDVDDLIINTLGGFFGFLITPLLTVFLPSKKELNERSLIKGQKVSLVRRSVSLLIDLILLSAFTLVFRVIFLRTKYEDYYVIASIILYFIIIPLLNNTKTPGKVLLKLEVVSTNNKYGIMKVVLRNILLSFIILFPSSWLQLLKGNISDISFYIIVVIITIIEIINFIYYIIPYGEEKEHLFLYERISQTKNKSTIIVEVEENEEKEIKRKNKQLRAK